VSRKKRRENALATLVAMPGPDETCRGDDDGEAMQPLLARNAARLS
jgi:hypothetical protein